MKPIVVVQKLMHGNELLNQFRSSFSRIALHDDFDRARAVFIKPNLTYPGYKKGVTTRLEFVKSLVTCLREINSSTTIYVGEAEGGYNSFSMTQALHTMGFYEFEKSYGNVRVVNLSELPSREVVIQAHGEPFLLNLPSLFFDEIDFSITCPLPKVHCMTTVTLSLKNQWGCLPDVMRLKNHYVFDQIIAHVCDRLKFRYAFLDGRYGLDDNGPMVGRPVEVNWFAASNSLGAFDQIVSEMMGFDWKKIGHLKAAGDKGVVPRRDSVEVVGDMVSLKRKFTLRRSFWNYPALAAFRSRRLTRLVYFSRFSKLLHDIMYIFRKRPITQ
ncbi:MAG: DUF362 domain-containing protein [Syntrophobacteraceae bacterium]